MSMCVCIEIPPFDSFSPSHFFTLWFSFEKRKKRRRKEEKK